MNIFSLASLQNLCSRVLGQSIFSEGKKKIDEKQGQLRGKNKSI
jgi:hypothetical protein